MTWNYRITRHRERRLGKRCVWYAIHEVYYHKNKRPYMISKEPIAPVGEDSKELEHTLVMMLKDALRAPVIDYDDPCFGKPDKKRK